MSNSLCAIALGSNLGDSLEIVQQALATLDREPGIKVSAVSAWYRTHPIGYVHEQIVLLKQPDFINGCALLETLLSPLDLLHTLLKIENQLGRVRREQWSARTLDLDLLLYEDQIILTPELIVPHPRMCQRAFVLIPLAEIAPHWIHPEKQRSIAELSRHPIDISLCRPASLNSTYATHPSQR